MPTRMRLGTICTTVSVVSSRSMRRSFGTTWPLRCWTPGTRPGPSRLPPEAIALYEAVPERARSYGCVALARVQLAKAALMGNRLDDAIEALGSVLALDPQRRISSLNEHLEACRQMLRVPGYSNSGAARELEQQLAAFSAASTARALPSGP